MTQESEEKTKFGVGSEMRWIIESGEMADFVTMRIKLIDDSNGVHVETITDPLRMRRLLFPKSWVNHESGAIEIPNNFYVDEGWRVLKNDPKTGEVRRVTLSLDEF